MKAKGIIIIVIIAIIIFIASIYYAKAKQAYEDKRVEELVLDVDDLLED